ncbi:MAG TPA: phage holin family protein [Thermoanaerobaculia bacterium]|nr:phage holin family protein [Thermoanaerobaculia bacterium]
MLTAKRMSTYASETDRSLGSIIKELSSDLSTLFRSEIALLKLEVRETVAKLGGGGALFAAAAFLAIFGIGFLFVTIVLGLVALGVPAWASTLIVTVVLFIAAGILAVMGRKKFAEMTILPTDSIDHIKADIDTIKSRVTGGRNR